MYGDTPPSVVPAPVNSVPAAPKIPCAASHWAAAPGATPAAPAPVKYG